MTGVREAADTAETLATLRAIAVFMPTSKHEEAMLKHIDFLDAALVAAAERAETLAEELAHLKSEWSFDSWRGDHLVYESEWQAFDAWQRRVAAAGAADSAEEGVCGARLTRNSAGCALPRGHKSLHVPLAVLWQEAGYVDGPWSPGGTEETG